MFTGLVEGRGSVFSIRSEGASVRMVVEVPAEMAGRSQHSGAQANDSLVAEPSRVGDSVAINGCCLTIVAIEGRRWSFQAGAETLSKTNLGSLADGSPVNLERALPVTARLGGHFVQGHVDGVGKVAAIEQDGEWTTMRFRVAEGLAKLMVPKGSVAVDGISLTVVSVEQEEFDVALIPHTLQMTTLGVRQVGDPVNIETDILGKYVQKLLLADPESPVAWQLERAANAHSTKNPPPTDSP